MGKLVTIETSTSVDSLVTTLREMLAMAEKGELRCMVGITINKGQCIMHVLAGEVGDNPYVVVGGLEAVKQTVLRNFIEEDSL